MIQIFLAIFVTIEKDKKAREHILEFGGYRDKERTVTFKTWINAAGNHAFDDYPEVYGITKHEGHQIRRFFQENEFRALELWQEAKSMMENK